nr:MAG TPA: PROTEIN complex, DNA ejection, VIRAL.33A [Bacteriophage sp.]DAS96649.1 MAG TPA: PROTEIN complex, DNA ejection, VIRAL.33A [Caudoviricetes sp.]
MPIHSLNTNCRIYIESEEPNPLAFVGAGWIGDYYRRTRQY